MHERSVLHLDYPSPKIFSLHFQSISGKRIVRFILISSQKFIPLGDKAHHVVFYPESLDSKGFQLQEALSCSGHFPSKQNKKLVLSGKNKVKPA
jgi:hypothetical protein